MHVFVGANVTWDLDLTNPFIYLAVMQRLLMYNFAMVIQYFVYLLKTLLCFYAVVILVNHLFGLLPDPKERLWFGKLRMGIKTVVVGDFLTEICLGLFAGIGILRLRNFLEPTSIVMWMYSIIYFGGTMLYFLETLPITCRSKVCSLLADEGKYEQTIWYSLTNSDTKLSTFSRVPFYHRVRSNIVDEWDWPTIRLILNDAISEEGFLYYLITVDVSNGISDAFKEKADRIVRVPHAKVLICIWGDEEQRLLADDLTMYFSDYANVRIRDCIGQRFNREVNVEELLYREKMNLPPKCILPMRFCNHKVLWQTYLQIGSGSKICLDFLQIILHKLDVLPAIYALFDFIDLQYRCAIACSTEISFSWMWRHRMMIGNISRMGKYLHKHGMLGGDCADTGFSTEIIYSDILTQGERTLIYKYLPNYQPDFNRPVAATINYLTSSLRNVLRGHGAFEIADANMLFELVFKLALLNTYILSANNISLQVDPLVKWKHNDVCYYGVRGAMGAKEVREVSPFLIAAESGRILLFNNFLAKEEIEYINYLDGTLVLPGIINISCDDNSVNQPEPIVNSAF